MRIKHLLLFFTVLSYLLSCKSDNNNFVIIGNITGMPEQNVVLEQLSANDVITILDSVKSDKDGHFEFSEVANEIGLYRLHFKSHKFILLSIDKGNLKIIGDWNTIENYNVLGSPASENLKKLIVAYREQMRDYLSMSVVLDTLKTKGNDSILNVAKKEFEDMKVNFTRFIETYSDTTPYLPNAIFAARILNPVTEGKYLDLFTQTLTRRFPNTKMTKDFTEYYLKVISKSVKLTKIHKEILVNDLVSEINLPTPEGNFVALSSLRGRYVLLNFWAGWCEECRTENANILSVYNKFNSKNFTVYSVSLDEKKEEWSKAILEDKLLWTQVSDLKRMESPIALQYNVQAIPANFLIDPSGKIVAINLHGTKLAEKLNELLK